jgi:L-cysteine/cystine lyase
VRSEFLATARTTFAGHFSWAESDSEGSYSQHPDARRFEASNYYRPAVLGLARSIGWLTMYVGLDFVHRRGMALARQAADALAAIDGVTLLTPRDRMATLISFRIDGWTAQAALDELAARTFAIARTLPLVDALRISVGFWTSDEELERFLEGVRLLAGRTPETLPARRNLPIIISA